VKKADLVAALKDAAAAIDQQKVAIAYLIDRSIAWATLAGNCGARVVELRHELDEAQSRLALYEGVAARRRAEQVGHYDA
jgi:hypothetical protein